MSTPQPAAAPATLVPAAEQLPKASPIPLTAASNMAYDGTAPQSSTEVPLAPIPEAAFSFGDGMDLSSLGIDQLQTMINSTNDLFNGGGENSGVDMSMFNMGDQGMTPGTQAETDKLLASLSSLPGQQTPNMSITVQPPSSTGDAQRDVDAILASFSAGQAQLNQAASADLAGAGSTGQQEFSFDFSGDGGDVYLSELVGLFTNASAPGTRLPSPNTQATALPGGQEQNVAGQQQQQQQQLQPSQPQSQPQEQPNPQQPQQPQPQQSQGQQQPQQNDQLQPPQSSQQPRASPSNDQTQQPVLQDQAHSQLESAQTQQPIQPQSHPESQPQQPIEVDSLPNPFDTPNMGNMGDIDMSALGVTGMTNPDGTRAGVGGIGVSAPNTTQVAGGNGDDDGGYTIEGINLDDFDFGNSGMPNVEGDEFESMFAEFK